MNTSSTVRRTLAVAAILAGAAVGALFFTYHYCVRDGVGAAGMPGRGSGDMTSWFITYKRPMAPPGMISQVVTETQGCLLTVTGPMIGVDLPDRAEIGRYRRPCGAEETGPLKRLADAALAEAAATRDVDMPRGTRFLTFGIGETGGDVDRLESFPMSIDFPAALRRFDDAMIATARKSLEKPAVTVRGTASPVSPVLAPRQALVVSVAIRNSGTLPVAIHNPAGAGEDEKAGLQLRLARRLPDESAEDEEPQFVRLRREDVVQLRAPGGEPVTRVQSFVRLKPGEELILSLKIGRRIHLQQGPYKAWVTYESTTDTVPEEEAVQGSLVIPVGSFAVKPPR
jgi:hypothetical protein